MNRLIGIFILIGFLGPSNAQVEFVFDTQNTDDTQIQQYWYGFVSKAGEKYNLIIEGTYSNWDTADWTDPCGSPETAPRFESKEGSITGTVGQDAEYTFALPNADTCNGQTLPKRSSSIEITLDDGDKWFHPSTGEGFKSNHVYTYQITSGGSNRIGVRQNHSINSNDYGKLRFIIEPSPCDTPTVFIGNDTILCPNETLELNAAAVGATYKWQDDSDQSTFKVNKPGKYWVKIETTCFYAVDTIYVDYVSFPNQILQKDTTLCDGDALEVDATIEGANYSWQDNNTSALYTITKGGNYKVEISKDGCTLIEELNIEGISIPQPKLEEKIYICEGEETTLGVAGDYIKSLWSTNSTENSITVSESGIYSVEVSNPCGSNKDTAEVLVSNCNCSGFFPNAFTPNGDALNNTFGPIYNCEVKTFKMSVFSKWGEKLFETTDLSNTWDGTYLGVPLQEGTYFYLADVIFSNKRKLSQKGTVYLLK